MGFRTVRIIFVSTLFLSVLAVSCKKESFNTGAGVTFSMSNKGVDTKAAYGTYDKDKKLQMIDWKEDDKVSICCYCPEAESPVSEKQGPVTYSVASVSTENHQSIAKVGALSDGLKWGGNHNHKFYCVYPAVGEGNVTEDFGFDDNNNCVVKGSIPVTQPQQEDLKPYMLMYGKAESQPEPKVDVDFYPLTTCVDFTIKFDVPMKVTNISLVSSDGKNLSGEFIYNFDTKECTSTTTGTNKVMVSYGDGQACTKKTELTFKLFVNPSDDIVEPYFAVNYIDTLGSPRYTKTQLKYKDGVSDEKFKFLKSHKTNVTGILVKEGFKITNFDGMELCPWSEETLDLPVEDELKTVFSLDTDSIEFSNDGESKELVITAYNYYERFPDVHYPVNSIPVVTCSDASWVTIGDPVQQTDKTKWIVTLQADANIGRSYDESTADFGTDRNNSKETAFDLSYYVPSTGETSQEQKTANCYVVNAPGWYKFPAKYGTGSNVKIDGVTYSGAGVVNGSNPEVTWQDEEGVIGDISFSETDKYIVFHVAPSKIKQENALISLKNNSTITWSWHIWVTPNKDFTKMPLGYCEAGGKQYIEYKNREGNVNVSVGIDSKSVKVSQNEENKEKESIQKTNSCTYYQWGRHIPFPIGWDEDNNHWTNYKVPWGSSTSMTVPECIQTPTIIYASTNSTNTSWLKSHISTLWGGEKTVFDPCPTGYKVKDGYSETTFGAYIWDGTSNTSYNTARLTFNTNIKLFWTLSNVVGKDSNFLDSNKNYFAWNALPIIPVAD